MVNDPNLIKKIISRINNLTFEQIDDAIIEVDRELGYVLDTIEIETKYDINTCYSTKENLLEYKTVHNKRNIFKRIFKKDDNDIMEAA